MWLRIVPVPYLIMNPWQSSGSVFLNAYMYININIEILIMQFSRLLTFLHTVYFGVCFSEPLEIILKASVTRTRLLGDRQLQSVQSCNCVEEKSGTKK